ncbi:MAG: hypothetical protein ACLT76_00975 [Clostridium fessum]
MAGEKRSLDANAYYWVLLSRLAEAAGISKPRAHNLMLRRYGQNLMIAGQMAYLVVPDTTEAEETALEAETFHIRPTSQVKQGKDGESIPYIYGACWIQYLRYKGNERVDKRAGSGMQGAGD